MEREEKKNILEKYIPLSREIAGILARADEYSSEAEKSFTSGNTFTGGIYKEQAEIAASKASKLLTELKETEKAVDQIENPLFRSVLRLRYFNGGKIYEVADEIHYSIRQTSDILNKALDELRM